MLILQLFLLVISLVNILLHTTGIYLLSCLYERNVRKVQQIYFINLSFVECIINVLELVKLIRDIVPFSESNEKTYDMVVTYISIFQYTCFAIIFYFIMVYITMDRLMEIVLHIKYPIYWNENKAKRLLQGTWIFLCLTATTVLLVDKYKTYPWKEICFKYVFTTLDFGFLIFTVSTYCFIFQKYKQSRVLPFQRVNKKIGLHQNFVIIRSVFRKSKFKIPVLLVITFIVFVIIPDITYLLVAVINRVSFHAELQAACWISYAVSNFADAWIYIFLQRDVRQLLLKKLHINNRFNGTIFPFSTSEVKTTQNNS